MQTEHKCELFANVDALNERVFEAFFTLLPTYAPTPSLESSQHSWPPKKRSNLPPWESVCSLFYLPPIKYF